jgi:hypothetical protein
MRLIHVQLKPEKLARLSSLSHPCSQLSRSVVPCSAAPPRFSAAHFRASRRQSGYAKATSSSTAQSWTSSLNCRPPLGANRTPPCAAASFLESTSPWTASLDHPLTPPTPLQARPSPMNLGVHFNAGLDSFSRLPPVTLLCLCEAAAESHSW